MHNVDLDILKDEMKDVISLMQKHFSYKEGSYYSQALFFLSIALHRLAPEIITKIIMLDADIKFMSDIKLLNDHFEKVGYL